MLVFGGKLAVVTGAGSGMGRELVLQLVADGCHVAMCDLNADTLEETLALAAKANPAGVTISSFTADASNRGAMEAFAEHVRGEHATDHLDLLFNNAGVGGGESFIVTDEKEWERTFDVCWGCVYQPTRVFLPMLMASSASFIVNTSSATGLYPSLGPVSPVSAYGSAKAAVIGFTEGLLTDLQTHAPNVRPILVMPGRVASSIAANATRFHDRDSRTDTDDSDRQLRHDQEAEFDSGGYVSSAAAAKVILDGIKAGKWRILIGDDAVMIDRMVRRHPEMAYSLHRRRVRWYMLVRYGRPVVTRRVRDRLRAVRRARNVD
jgi:NAD(P)-dependent dehydrogenase (short-subunit alcohol dehydrogenase family)